MRSITLPTLARNTAMELPDHPFLRNAGRILNSGQARSLVLSGNIHDLFCHAARGRSEYVPLINFLTANWDLPHLILVVYELNGPIRFLNDAEADQVRNAWLRWRSGYDGNELAIQRMMEPAQAASALDHIVHAYDDNLRKAISNPTLALEMLRQMCLCARTEINGERLLPEHLLILIEGADMLVPDAPIHTLSDMDRQRITILHDWFSDPGFMNSRDSVVLTAESRSLLHHRIARLPSLLEVEVPAPDEKVRRHFIHWFMSYQQSTKPIRMWSSEEDLARATAGLSIHALAQLMKGAAHESRLLTQEDVIAKVEDFIQSQLGEDIVEFKKPGHTLEDVIGFTRLKGFLRKELIPRFNAATSATLPGAAVSGPIGSGKTFIFEAMATELDMVVLVLKNIRSQWFGQTDVVFERLKRVLNALNRVLIFIDEADTQFGGVGSDTHETERRLTGKLQAMMSDTQLRGKVFWLLVTARIHLLSPDLRRPGRVGDLIIPVLDPEGEDREAFLLWMVRKVVADQLNDRQKRDLLDATQGFSSAAFASMKSTLKARAGQGLLPFDTLIEIIRDYLPPAIEDTRRYQTLQALINCTRRSLLPDPEASDRERSDWEQEIRELERKGIC